MRRRASASRQRSATCASWPRSSPRIRRRARRSTWPARIATAGAGAKPPTCSPAHRDGRGVSRRMAVRVSCTARAASAALGDVDAAERTLLEAATPRAELGRVLDGARLHRVRPAALDAIARLRAAGRRAAGAADAAVARDQQVPRPAGTHRVLCHEQMGELASALAWAERARSAMPAPDAPWDERTARLQKDVGASPAVTPLGSFVV